MAHPQTQPVERYTYSDYLGWPNEERWELIDGAAWNMTPAPLTEHQRISMALGAVLYAFFRGSPCQVFAAPTDVLLPEGDEPDGEAATVVQPDLVVVCDRAKVRERHVRGAPDFVVEIVSPSTARKDERVKRSRYERAGISEYWLVHPSDRTVRRYRLEQGRYGPPDVYGPEDRRMSSSRFPEFSLDLRELFGLSGEGEQERADK